jgi:hypothetical protein
MSNEIRVGDLVMVVRPNGCPSCEQVSLGKVFAVTAINGIYTSWYCTKCDRDTTDKIGTDVSIQTVGGKFHSRRLKRIAPLSEPESVETNERITA